MVKKNPLRKRYLRELKGEFSKYLIIFLLMTFSVGLLSGYLVADESMLKTYDESFEKYNIENGNFTAKKQVSPEQKELIEENGIKIYEQFYLEKPLTNGSRIRLFSPRKEVNLVCLMQGAMPSAPDEAAIDRMYANNNGLKIGDYLTIDEEGGATYRITGLVALSDYSTLFENNNDMMFDALKFGVGIITDTAISAYPARELTFNYAWKYLEFPKDDMEEKAVSDELIKKLAKIIRLEDFVPGYLNQAIHFSGEDLEGDGVMMIALIYIIIVILAFVFAVNMTSTIAKEAPVIGTLLATGYTRGQLLLHYMLLPIMVSMAGAAIGNVLGYTWLKDLCAALYYNSYSLPTYETVWSAYAFFMTTFVPLVIMLAVNTVILGRGLRHTPIQFLRRDFHAKKKKKAVRLSPNIPFITRFKLRVVFQNVPNYLILFAGVLFADLLLLFGMGMPNLMNNYQTKITDSLFANYQYVLSAPVSYAGEDENKLDEIIKGLRFAKAVETENPDAEKFSAWSLRTLGDYARTEDITLYGIEGGSRYVKGDFADGEIIISASMAEKYRIGAGDTFTLKEAYEDKYYTLEISGINDYESAVAVFMNRQTLNEMFDQDPDFFCGYFSDTKITDIDESYIGSIIDIDAMTKVPRQLMHSMGGLMDIVNVFAIVIFLIVIYFLIKIIIEKNEHSISMAKILGYSEKEIRSIYLHSTSAVMIVLIIISVPIIMLVLKQLFYMVMLEMMSGWLPLVIDSKLCYITMLLGFASYVLVTFVEMRKIRKIPMDMALKNVE